MPSRTRRKAASLSRKTAELGLAVPVVVAHRVARMAMAGPAPSARDRQECMLMVMEKQLAFGEAWWAMSTRSMLAGQAFLESMLRLPWSPWLAGSPSAGNAAARLQEAALDVLHDGLAPVHRKAVANSKRLAGTPLR